MTSDRPCPLQQRKECLRSISSGACPACQVWHFKGEVHRRISWDPINILAWISKPENGHIRKSNQIQSKGASPLQGIVRRLVLRLRCIFSVAMWAAHTCASVLSGQEEKKNGHEICDPGIPAQTGTTNGTQARQLTCDRKISLQGFQGWHCPGDTAPRSGGQ